MTQFLFRNNSPKRSCTKAYASYQQYKTYLAKDFNKRCGYTDCCDRWFGGQTTFHIDHFKPLAKYPTLEREYSNLVYACSYINILKSDDDPERYLDPCDEDYNKHFYRDQSGNIYPNPASSQAMYMHTKLKLGLARYQVIWLLEELFNKMQEVDNLRKSLADTHPEKKEMLSLLGEFASEFIQYFNYLTK